MSWDLAITLLFVITVAFALVLGRPRTVLVFLSAYVALAVASVGGPSFHEITAKLFEGATPFVVQAILFGCVILLLVLKGEFPQGSESGPRQLSGTIMTALYGFFLAGMALSAVFSFMGPAEAKELYASSPLAGRINDLRFWWLILPVILMVSNSFLSRPAAPKE